jgi:lipopolysaccharide biosynthesis protein
LKYLPHKAYLQSGTRAYLRDCSIRLLSSLRVGKFLTLLTQFFSGSQKTSGTNKSYSPTLLDATKIAIFAHYSEQVKISSSDAYLVSQLKDSGFAVIISTTCTDDFTQHQQLWDQWRHKIDGLITRRNTGFDFGSWSAAITSLQNHRGDIEQIILINNSLYGPLFPLKPIIEGLALRGDFFGLTASREFCPHLQSYFLGFNKVVIDHPDFHEFWSDSFSNNSKWLTIFRRELAWENFFIKRGFKSAVLIETTRNFPRNPLTFLWKDLITQGFPFMKKSLLTHNYDSIDMTHWEAFLMTECPQFEVSLVIQDLKY